MLRSSQSSDNSLVLGLFRKRASEIQEKSTLTFIAA